MLQALKTYAAGLRLAEAGAEDVDRVSRDIEAVARALGDVFDWLQDRGGISDAEMLRTFNCGIGMVMIVPARESERLASEAESLGVSCHDIGRVISANGGDRVRFIA